MRWASTCACKARPTPKASSSIQNSVAIGSHNWSRSGALDNRDATLIFRDAPEIAQYYERVFLNDWGVLAKDVMPTELFAPLLAGDDEETPPGMQRIT